MLCAGDFFCTNLDDRCSAGACAQGGARRFPFFYSAAAATSGITIVGTVVFNHGEQRGSGDFTLGGALGCGGAISVYNCDDSCSGGACTIGDAGVVDTLGCGSVSLHSMVGLEIITPVLVTFVVSSGDFHNSWCAYFWGDFLSLLMSRLLVKFAFFLPPFERFLQFSNIDKRKS